MSSDDGACIIAKGSREKAGCRAPEICVPAPGTAQTPAVSRGQQNVGYGFHLSDYACCPVCCPKDPRATAYSWLKTISLLPNKGTVLEVFAATKTQKPLGLHCS